MLISTTSESTIMKRWNEITKTWGEKIGITDNAAIGTLLHIEH